MGEVGSSVAVTNWQGRDYRVARAASLEDRDKRTDMKDVTAQLSGVRISLFCCTGYILFKALVFVRSKSFRAQPLGGFISI